MERKKICFVVAVYGTAISFLRDHIEALGKDYDVYLAGNIKSKESIEKLKLSGYAQIPINRKISVFNDLKAVWFLFRYFRKMKFEAVHSVTPKAGLVCALAGFMAGVPHRIHIFTGQVWATQKGIMRKLLMTLDKVIAGLNNHILVDGESQRQYLISNGIFKTEKSKVLGSGSICGVNTERFKPSENARLAARKEIGIPDDKIVFVFMGRLNHDKGMYELLPAFDKLVGVKKNVYLLLFGPDEENVAKTFHDYKNLKEKENFYYYGSTPEPYKMLQAGDVFVLPTYREGFGSSIIEAACLGIPTITSDVYGVQDASIPEVTGLQCKVGDVDSLYENMVVLAENAPMRQMMGANGRKRVLDEFAGEVVVRAWKDFYTSILG